MWCSVVGARQPLGARRLGHSSPGAGGHVEMSGLFWVWLVCLFMIQLVSFPFVGPEFQGRRVSPIVQSLG